MRIQFHYCCTRLCSAPILAIAPLKALLLLTLRFLLRNRDWLLQLKAVDYVFLAEMFTLHLHCRSQEKKPFDDSRSALLAFACCPLLPQCSVNCFVLDPQYLPTHAQTVESCSPVESSIYFLVGRKRSQRTTVPTDHF